MGRRELFSLGELEQVEKDHPNWDDLLLAKHFGVSPTAIKNKRALKKKEVKKETKKKPRSNSQSISHLQKCINKEVAKMIAVDELAKIRLKQYNKRNYCKEDSIVITESKYKALLQDPNLKKLDKEQIKRMLR